ncbi:MAG: O-methyltransferase [Crocinitomicaceae bacterium]
MDFLPADISIYSENHTSPESHLLEELNRETHLKVLIPRMLSGHLQGRFLSMLSHMIKPKNILEIGTYTGYSALCLAEGLLENGTIDTIDMNEELSPIVEKYWAKSDYKNQINFHIGNALDILPALTKSYDIVFIDADKENYSTYFDLVFDKLPIGAHIIADNVLWSGNVLKDRSQMKESTAGIAAFNEKIQNDDRVENLLIPIRDGLMVLRKIKD